jgi:hypothetical protein
MFIKLHLNKENQYKLRKCMADRKFLDPLLSYLSFVKLRKEIINFAMSVYLSVPMEQLGSSSTDFHDLWCLLIFRKSVENVQVPFKSDKRNEYSVWRPMYIYNNISLNYFWNEKCFGRELWKNHTHIFYVKQLFSRQ